MDPVQRNSSSAVEAFGQVLEEIASELELRPLLTNIARHACELLRADDASIGLVDARRQVVSIEAIHRMPDSELGAKYGLGKGLVGRVLQTGAPLVLRRYGDLAHVTLPELADQAVIGVPILEHGGKLVGVFGVGARPPRQFDATDVKTLQLFARHAAIAIQNAVRYDQERRRSERMTLIARVSRLISAGLEPEELVATAADVIHAELGYPNVVIPLIHRDDGEYLLFRSHAGAYTKIFEMPYRLPLTSGITGAAVTQRVAQVINDVASDPRYVPPPLPINVSAELAVPLMFGEEVFGCINIEGLQAFDEDDVRSIQIIADHLAVAIKNARLSSEAREAAVMRERRRVARDLHDAVSQALSSISMTSQSLVSAWRRDPAEGERRAHRLEELSRLAFAEMRALLRELRPEPEERPQGADNFLSGIDDVKRLGLRGALQKLSAVLAPEIPAIRLDFYGYAPQSRKVEEELYLICREALSNAIRHSKARVVHVRGEKQDNAIRITVADNGIGFDRTAQAELAMNNAEHGIGLQTMAERAKGLRGTCDVHTSIGAGTLVEIFLPCVPAEAADE